MIVMSFSDAAMDVSRHSAVFLSKCTNVCGDLKMEGIHRMGQNL